jgi:hypothetical protein
MGGCYIRQEPYIDEDGIYVPDKEYIPKGSVGTYHCVMTKEMFIEAYNKWVKGDEQ